MSYIGKEPDYTSFPSKSFSGDGTAMSISLDRVPPNAASALVFIDGIRQDTSAYTIAGSLLTFTDTVASGTNNIQVVTLGISEDAGTTGDETVTAAKLVTSGTASSGTFLRGDMAWADAQPVGGVAGEDVFYTNEKEINSSYTIPASTNAMSAGPINIASGVTVNLSSGSNWTIA